MSVLISGDGNTVAMGTMKGGLLGGGFVQTYKYQGSDWVTYLPGIDALGDGEWSNGGRQMYYYRFNCVEETINLEWE